MSKFITFLLVTVMVVGICLLVAFPVMWLWNDALVPAIPSLAKITYLQALGIKVLVGLLSYNTPNSSKKS